MSHLAPQLLVILHTLHTSKLLQNNFRTELEWLNKLFPTKKAVFITNQNFKITRLL